MIIIQNVVSKVRTIYQGLSKSQKLYFIATSCLLIHFFTRHLPEPANKTFFSLAIIFFVWVVIYDFLSVYKALWETLIGKGILLLAYTLLANLSLSIGSQYVNNAVGVEPYLYKYSIIFSAIMSVPIVASLVLAVIWLLVVIFGSLYLFLGINLQQVKSASFISDLLPATKEQYFVLTTIVRILVIASISYSSFSIFSGQNAKYNDFVLEQTEAFIFHFEALDKSRCELEKGVKYLPVNEKELIIITRQSDGDYKFKLALCKSRLHRS